MGQEIQDVKRYIEDSGMVISGLWNMQQLADFLNLPIQSIYDYRYHNKIEESIFIHVGRNLRVNPWKAMNLALKEELIKA